MAVVVAESISVCYWSPPRSLSYASILARRDALSTLHNARIHGSSLAHGGGAPCRDYLRAKPTQIGDERASRHRIGMSGRLLGTNSFESPQMWLHQASLQAQPQWGLQPLSARCVDINVLVTHTAMLCNSGWGVYSTKEECDAAGGPPGPKSISRATYPRPKPTRRPNMPNMAQGVLECPTLPIGPGNGQTACPFSQPNLDWWQDPSVWCVCSVDQPTMHAHHHLQRNGTVPTSGDVTIPPNTNLVVSACSFDGIPPTFGAITIPPGSALIVTDADFAWTVASIVVNGSLLVGSPTCRLNANVAFNFARPNGSSVPDAAFGIIVRASMCGSHVAQLCTSLLFGFRFWRIVQASITLAVHTQVNAGGQIDMHGRQYGPTWTNLAATATVGATSIQVQDTVAQWQVGQQIVIVTTYYKDVVSNQNEVRTITAVDGNTVSFSEPLLFQHYGYVLTHVWLDSELLFGLSTSTLARPCLHVNTCTSILARWE